MPPHHRITAPLHHRVTVSVSHLPCPLPPNQSVICLAPYHHVTASLHHRVTASPCHRVTASPRHRVTVLVSHLPCPLPPNQSVICLASCHQTSQSFSLPPTTKSPRHRITTPPHHRITVLVSHLPCPLPPNQSVICLAPCHQTSQSFALPPATKPVSHLPCPLPLRHCATASPRHCVSQSFALPPATKPVSHLPCPLPPNQSVICLAPYHHVTASPHHRITASPRHRITASLPQIFPTTWVWIWLVNANQHSCDWLIVPTTANQITGIEKPNYHKTLIFFPTTSLKWWHEARIDELADSNKPAIKVHNAHFW